MSVKGKLLTVETLNPNIKNVEYAVRGPIVQLASKLEKDLEQGVKKPYENVVWANIGDCHAVGQKPITFIRQVIAACVYPDFIEQEIFPKDVNERAKRILSGSKMSLGCYSEAQGLEYVRENVASFIEERDGSPADKNAIFLTNGAETSVKLLLPCFISPKNVTGVMIPIPQFPLYSATISEFGMYQIGYYLNEVENWKLDIAELKRSIEKAKQHCKPRVLCVINPGNPTGQVLSYNNIREIIEFCMEENLFLLADEVYQDNIYGNEQFHSFKKVLRDMGQRGDGFEMASIHSVSKGYAGECGLRGGYFEVVGIADEVLQHLKKLKSAHPSTNTVGQIVVDCITNPPKPGDESFELFRQEKANVLDSLKTRGEMVYKMLNSIEGISCNEVMGAMYAFPRMSLPKKAIEKAESMGEKPDFFYCKSLLLEAGLCVVPGSGFGQQEGTFHFRCGLRGGYFEVVGIADEVLQHLKKLKSAHPSTNTVGQIVVDCITNPPKPGDESFELFRQEKANVLDSLKTRGEMVYKMLNSIEGISCNEVMGAMYAFPRMSLPKKAIEKAESMGEKPDFFYCKSLLLEAGLCVVPGSGFGQQEGTFHFRMTILPPVEQIKSFLERFRAFHLQFLKTYS